MFGNIKQLTICFLGALSISTAAEAQSIGIGASKQGSQNYAANAGFAKLLSEELGYDVRVQSFGGSGQTMPLVDNARLDLLLAPSPDFSAAAGGTGAFEGRQLGNLRVVAAMGGSAYGFMVNKSSSMTMVAEAKGKSITYGYTAQPTLRPQVDAILAGGGLSIDDMQLDNVPSVPNGVDDLISGTAEVAFFALAGGKTREADAAIGIRWLGLENTPDALAGVREFVPTAYIDTVPAGSAPGVETDTNMMFYDYVLLAGAHVPDETIAPIVAFIHDNPEKVRSIFKTFARFDPSKMAPDMGGLVYHPAADQYYQQAGMSQ
ncbi:hypothetical protein MACH17_14950 [Phaeobacter inhibens]|uniref:TAXI family TRAP transporter solute-binding subunit n=1 Tax=Phaeobacter inhibens TaxID=221822 RepID=UPI0027657092|nr:TAXI family TRAP transporter solute-binding subunit [Phaeobacter inhibens]GLO69978.1 hypothetical protein MACH17_14950 [Phaeobacter inhibens]